jgi:L-ribulose-5-phosphate 4-epimerase
MLDDLKQQVCEANRALERHGLVTLTWGNVSGFDRDAGLMVIKPSGVPYADLQPEDLVVVDPEGQVVEGDLKPSSDSPTHLVLYRNFDEIGGVVHTHSKHATMFCQACLELPCMGTTHADHFYGAVPLARALVPEEIEEDYEGHTGNVIVERFAELDPVAVPGVLVAHHAPFTWGPTVGKALDNSIALEACAEIAVGTMQLHPKDLHFPGHVLDKHYRRKHGPDAYYGQ